MEPIEKVTLRHPHTGDVQVVDGTEAQLVPLMCKGYEQYHQPAQSGQGVDDGS